MKTIGAIVIYSLFFFIPTFAQSTSMKVHSLFQSGKGAAALSERKDQIESITGVELHIEQIPGTILYEKLMVEFMAQTGAYDLIEFYPTWMGDFVEEGFLLNLDPYFRKYAEEINLDDYIARVQLCKWKGSWYGVPFSGDVNVFYYRKDLLEDSRHRTGFEKRYGYELKVPDTWDEVLDVAEYFNGWDWDDDGKINYGIGLVSRGWGGASHWSNVYHSYGADFFDEKGEVALQKEAFSEANKVWMSLLRYAPPGALNFGFADCFEVLAQGQVAMAIQWATPIFRDPSRCAVYDRLGYAVMPGVKRADGTIHRTPALAGSRCLAVPVTSRNPDKAFRIAMCLSSEEMQLYQTISRTGTNPTRYSVFQNPRAREVWGEMIPVCQESLRIGHPDIKRRGSRYFYEVISSELGSLWADEQTVETAYEKISSQWNNIVKELPEQFPIEEYPEQFPPGPTKFLETAISNWNEYYGANVKVTSWVYKGRILSGLERKRIVSEMTHPEKAWFPHGDVAYPAGVTARRIKDYPTITPLEIKAWQEQVASRVAVNNHVVEIKWKFSSTGKSFKTVCMADDDTLKYDSMLFNAIIVRQRSLDLELLWMWGTKRGEITAKVNALCENGNLIDCEHESSAWLSLGNARINCRVTKDPPCCRLECSWAFATPLLTKIAVAPDNFTLEVEGLGLIGMGSKTYIVCCD